MSGVRGLVLLMIGLSYGCQSTAKQGFADEGSADEGSADQGSALAEEVPALVSAPTADTAATLRARISDMLGGISIRLDPHPFAQSSLLTLEHAPKRSMGGNAAGSLILGKPEQFRLVLSGNRCLLVRLKTDERVAVDPLRCHPESNQAP